MDEARRAGLQISEALGAAAGTPVTYRKARVLAYNAGPPKTVDVKIEDRYTVNGVPYVGTGTPAVNDAIYVVKHGTSQRLALQVLA